MRVTDKLLAGLAFAYSEYKGDFGNSGGNFKLSEPMLHVLRRLRRRPVVRRRHARRRQPRLQHVKRNIPLGAATRTETGDTNGWHNVARVLGGYWFKHGDWDHGPFAKLTWEKAVVRQFSENGSDSTALTYGQQENEALISSVGWQVAGNWSGFRPFARVDVGIRLQERRARSHRHAGRPERHLHVPVSKPDDN